MQIWQLSKNIRYHVAKATWADPPTALVLTGGAEISADDEANYTAEGDNATLFPFARVECDGFDRDSESPTRIAAARFQVHVVCWAGVFANDSEAIANRDEHGGEAIRGGTRDTSQGQGKSTGRGVDEVVGRLVEYLNDGVLIDSTIGMQGFVTDVGPAIPVAAGSHFVKRVISIEIHNATTQRRYHAPFRLAATALGGGQVSLTWTLPPDRYDRYKLILRWGTTAPSSPTAGTGVTLSSDLATSVTATGVTTGTRYFSLFVAYDETHSPASTEERYSDALSKSVVVT